MKKSELIKENKELLKCLNYWICMSSKQLNESIKETNFKFEVQNKIIKRAIHFIETNTKSEPKSKRIASAIVSELNTLIAVRGYDKPKN